MKMQNWMDKTHGKVTAGIYKGCLLRAGAVNGKVYIDILLVNDGWNRLDTFYTDSSPPYEEEIDSLKQTIDIWLED